jgi:hypothetical protein
VRLLVEQGFEEPLGKPNASPRPSILRKRDHDSSPGKGTNMKNKKPFKSICICTSNIYVRKDSNFNYEFARN